MLRCSKCETEKPMEAFAPSARKPGSWCRACEAADYQRVLATGVCFQHRLPLVDGKKSKCAKCLTAWRRWAVKKTYGISVDQYDAMLLHQGGGCAVCGSKPGIHTKGKSWVRSLAIDHCHETGRVRGILCVNCNNAIGQAKESAQRLRSLAEYLEPTPEWIGGGC